MITSKGCLFGYLEGFLVPINGQEGESKSNTRIVEEDGLGRVIVSTDSFVLGDCVIREKPILVWEDHSILCSYIEGFIELPQEHQSVILDMFSGDVLEPHEIARIELALLMAMPHLESQLGAQKVRQLIRIAILNTFAFHGYRNVQYLETIGTINPGRRSALFAYSSKLAHSCLPNVSYSSKTEDGCLESKAIRKISDGDHVTFSYINKLFSSPTSERRSKLQQTKGFFCKCVRCIGPDFCRVHKCPRSDCKDYVSCFHLHVDSPSFWKCSSCGPLEECMFSELLEKENIISKKLNMIKNMLMGPGGVSNVHPKLINMLLLEADEHLLPIHYLNLRVLEEKVHLCASHSAGMEQIVDMGMMPRNFRSPVGTIMELRGEAAVAGLQFVSRAECVAASCLGCDCDGSCVHPPLYECTTEIFHAYQDLKYVPSCSWLPYAACMLRRYVPLLYITFGESDTDVKEIEEAVKVKTSTTHMKLSSKAKKGNKKKQRKNKEKRKSSTHSK